MEKMKQFKLSLNGIVLFAAFLGIVVIGAVVNENFLTIRNILSIFQQMPEMGIMAIGLTIVIITGGNDLASGTTMGLCAVISGLCLTSGMPIVPALLISVTAAVACGSLNAFLVAVIGIPPMIATLGTKCPPLKSTYTSIFHHGIHLYTLGHVYFYLVHTYIWHFFKLLLELCWPSPKIIAYLRLHVLAVAFVNV